ncbi:MAG: GAF domain-containing protein [Woeseia sp.]
MKTETNEDFKLLVQQLEALIGEENNALANAANFVGLLYHALANVNWLGIYVLRDNELVLGPFQGQPACVRIPLGRGACGTAAKLLQTVRVADVHAFAGHIACDPASRSEIVVPLTLHGQLAGVLDIDSPSLDRFTEADQQGVEWLCRHFTADLERKGVHATAFI